MSDLPKRLNIKAGVMEMGERIAFGSDTALMREAADKIVQLEEAKTLAVHVAGSVSKQKLELEAENQRLREALEDLYSMASSPQWRNDPLYRICELIEKALEQSDD